MAEHDDGDADCVAVDDIGYLFRHHCTAVALERIVAAEAALQRPGVGQHEVEDDDGEQDVDDEAVRGVDDGTRRFRQVGRRVG